MPESKLDLEVNNSVITGKKVCKGIAGYIWDSPCFKPLVYNPYILSVVVVLIIWLADLLYGKQFCRVDISTTVQHMMFTYVLVATGVILNNMVIKHRYRLDKYEQKNKEVEPPIEYTTEYS